MFARPKLTEFKPSLAEKIRKQLLNMPSDTQQERLKLSNLTRRTPAKLNSPQVNQIGSQCQTSSQRHFLFITDHNTKASVVSLDYSNCGGYLSSVYENGTINIFGLTTKIKSDTISFDRDSTLARFNPAKRFHLAVASYKGGVTVYDIASKRIHFQQKDAHDAPCRDIAMPEDVPDRLLSCGCDSLVKIFDTRKKATGLQIRSSCGLSTISVSKCGGFFCVGNLKGDIITYDMRSLRQPLTKMKVDNELVTRVTFMPTWGDSDNQFPSMSQRDSGESAVSDELPDLPEANDDYTMDDIIGFQKGRISELETSRVSSFSAVSVRGDYEGRMSENFGRNIANALKDLSFTSDTSFIDNNATSPEQEERGSNIDRMRRGSGGRKESLQKRRSSFMPSPLQLIQEEIFDKENFAGSLNTQSTGTPTASGPRFSSTPNPSLKPTKGTVEANDSADEIIDVEAYEKTETEDDADGSIKKKSSSGETLVPPSFSANQLNIDLKKEFEDIHAKIHFEVQSLGLDLNGRHMEMMSYIFNQRRQLQSRIDMVEECVGYLLNDDVKINRIMELQDENRDLRSQLDEIMKRLNH